MIGPGEVSGGVAGGAGVDEDLREGLGLTSLYNLSLGTTSEEHLYDRVVDRDKGAAARPWEK
jgi:hypothetical protein